MDKIYNYLIALGVLVIFIGLFIVTYLLNKKTPKPEGCVNPKEECKLCGIVTCSHNPINNENKGE